MKFLLPLLLSFKLSAMNVTVHQLFKEQEPIILDVRTPEEFTSGRIKSAINLDAYDPQLIQKLNELDKKPNYFVICRSGRRSRIVAREMKKLRFKNPYNVLGGMLAWKKANYPVTK